MPRTLLLKVSGEALGADDGAPIDRQKLNRLASEIIHARNQQRIALVVGGGNIIRGAQLGAQGGDPCRGDYMGMMATLINALALQDAFLCNGQPCEVVAPHAIPNVARAYDRHQVQQFLDDGVIVVFGGGTGHPYFTTDTTAALRAVEIGADELLKGSNVDGIYDSDPNKNADAKRYEEISFEEVLTQRLRVMDQTAFALCREQSLSIRVFNMTEDGAFERALSDHPPGTVVK